MFKAIDKISNAEVIIVDRKWNLGNIDELREKSRLDNLVCPECSQPLVVKAGNKKAWHFAHRDLSDCPLRNESPELLQARRILYQWLVSKVPEGVTLEKSVEHLELSRPLDCYVEYKGRKYGYFIVDSMRKDREALEAALFNDKIHLNLVFLVSSLKLEEEQAKLVNLCKTERELARFSKYDQLYQKMKYFSTNSSTLHYLDFINENLITLRNLRLEHKPAMHRIGLMLNNRMEKIQFSPENGEFVHPGEFNNFKQKLELKRRYEEEERLRLEREEKEREEEERRRKEEFRKQQEQWRIEAEEREKELSRREEEHRERMAAKREARRNEFGGGSDGGSGKRNFDAEFKKLARQIKKKHESYYEKPLKHKKVQDDDVVIEEYYKSPAQIRADKFNQAYKCVDCGETTADWSELFPEDKTCLCQKCALKRLEE